VDHLQNSGIKGYTLNRKRLAEKAAHLLYFVIIDQFQCRGKKLIMNGGKWDIDIDEQILRDIPAIERVKWDLRREFKGGNNPGPEEKSRQRRRPDDQRRICLYR